MYGILFDSSSYSIGRIPLNWLFCTSNYSNTCNAPNDAGNVPVKALDEASEMHNVKAARPKSVGKVPEN